MKVILTGNSGSGKSEALLMFKELGFEVFNADKIVHQLYQKGQHGFDEVVSHFGSSVADNSEINRKILGQIVRNRPEKLALLNKIIHPLVSQLIKAKISDLGPKKAVFELPVYFENRKYYKGMFNKIIVIQRESTNVWHNLQTPSDEYKSKADFIIQNNGTISELRNSIIKITNSLK